MVGSTAVSCGAFFMSENFTSVHTSSKRIGLLGGMSAASSQLYYAELCRLTQAERGGLSSPDLMLRSLDFAPLEAWMVIGNWDAIADTLSREACQLQAAGAELIALATNTMHNVAAEIETVIDVPFVHIADATAAALNAAGSKTPGLIGTQFTMEQTFYLDRLRDQGMDPLVPGASSRSVINDIIFGELCKGIVLEDSADAFIKAATELAFDGADSLILGCTEVCMLLNEDNTPLPVFDTTAIHCEAILKAAWDC